MPPNRNQRRPSPRHDPAGSNRPRRDRSDIRNYANIEIIDEPIANPPRQPTVPQRELVPMPPGLQLEGEDILDDNQPVDQPLPEAQHAIPTTVTLRSVGNTARPKSEVSEWTWVKDHFDIELLPTTFVRKWRKDKAEYQDRRWSCKYCALYSTTDSKRSGSTSNLSRHLEEKHNFTQEKHDQGLRPSQSNPNQGSLVSLTTVFRPVLSSEEGTISILWRHKC